MSSTHRFKKLRCSWQKQQWKWCHDGVNRQQHQQRAGGSPRDCCTPVGSFLCPSAPSPDAGGRYLNPTRLALDGLFWLTLPGRDKGMSQVTRSNGNVRGWLLCDWAGCASSCSNTPHYEVSWEHVVARGIEQRQNTDMHSGMCHGLSASTKDASGQSSS